MSTEIISPTPQRPYKRAFSHIDSNVVHPNKRTWQSPPPLLIPLSHAQRSEGSRPPRRPSSISLEDIDTLSAPPKKRRRLLDQQFEPTDDHRQVTRSSSAPPWPTCAPGSKHFRAQLPAGSSVDTWIATVFNSDHRSFSPEPRPISPPNNRPSTCPATIDISNHKRTPQSLTTIKQMSQQPSQYREIAGSSSAAS